MCIPFYNAAAADAAAAASKRVYSSLRGRAWICPGAAAWLYYTAHQACRISLLLWTWKRPGVYPFFLFFFCCGNETFIATLVHLMQPLISDHNREVSEKRTLLDCAWLRRLKTSSKLFIWILIPWSDGNFTIFTNSDGLEFSPVIEHFLLMHF